MLACTGLADMMEDISLHDKDHLANYETIEWVVARYKSLLQGVGEGFYDDSNYLQNDQCMNIEAIEAIDRCLEAVYHGSGWLDSILKVTAASFTFVVSVNENCNTHAFVYDTISFCFMTNRCSGFILMINIIKELYPLTISFMQIANEYVVHWHVNDLRELKESYRTIGSELGSILVYLINY